MEPSDSVKKTERKRLTGAAAMGPGPGRPKGAVNKVTAEIKTMIIEALQNAGGVDYLTERALDPKTAPAFLSLLGKILPTQVTGGDGGPVQVIGMNVAEFRQIAAETAAKV